MQFLQRQNRVRGFTLGLGLALVPLAVTAQDPMSPRILAADTPLVLLPSTTAQTLDDGRVAVDPARGAYALRIIVRPPEPDRAWVLLVRASTSTFRSEGSGKRCQDLWWKFDHEGSGAYRPVEDMDTVVLERPGGGSAEAVLDLRVDLNWSTPPGIYDLGLVFTLASE